MKELLKKAALFIMVFVFAVSVVACGGGNTVDTSTPEGIVEAMLDAFIKTDFDEIEKYVDLDQIISREENENLLADPDVMMKEVFGEIKYNIVEAVKEDENTYLVKTQIVTTDMGSAVSEYIIEVMSYIYGENVGTAEEAEKYQEELFMEKITDENRNTTYNEVDIKVVKDGEGWKVEPDEDFSNAVLGGFHSAIETLMEQIAATEANNEEAEETLAEEGLEAAE